jgi:cadmium resistance protein CadD (predicted permease)
MPFFIVLAIVIAECLFLAERKWDWAMITFAAGVAFIGIYTDYFLTAFLTAFPFQKLH